MNIGEKFMLLGLEYEVSKIKEDRISAKLLSNEGSLPETHSKFLIGNSYYNLIYVNKGQKFITMKKLS